MRSRGNKNKPYMGKYLQTKKGLNAAIWCINNKILVVPRQSAHQTLTWYIDIEKGDYPNRKKLGTSPIAYRPGEIWDKVQEYQLYYYNKYKKEKDE
jgi:hypothetical protein